MSSNDNPGDIPRQSDMQAGSLPVSPGLPTQTGGQPMVQTTADLSMETGLPHQPTYLPLVDIYNTPDEIRIVIDTPGFSTEDIHIEVDNGILMVSAEREPDNPDLQESHLCQCHLERPMRLERMVQLPPGADPDHASAENDHGTTTITFTKNDSMAHHKIGFQ